MGNFFCCCCQNQDDELIEGAGLPNIGNTCYLNTALQIIYSMKDVKRKIISFSSEHSQAQCHQKINRIMTSLDKRQSSEQKKRQLNYLKRYLEAAESIPQSYKQDDLIRVLVLIFNKLTDQNPKFMSSLQMECTKQCDCNLDLIYTQTLISLNEKCGRCNKKLKVVAINTPKYILIIPSERKAPELKINILGNRQSKGYKLIALGNYYKFAESGHYIAVRLDESGQKLIEIDDSCARIVKSITNYLDARLLIYKQGSISSISNG